MSWIDYTLNRLASSVFVLLVASMFIFSILRLIPGDPATIMLGQSATPSAIATLRSNLGLDLPIWQQYIQWISGIISLEMGTSLASGQEISTLVSQRYPRSLLLAFSSLIIAIIISIPLGIIAASNHNSRFDYFAIVSSQVGISTPQFVLGIFFILIFAGMFDLLPSSGYVSPTDDLLGFATHIMLPAITLGIINGAALTRFLRSEMIEELSQDYVRTAKAYGISKSQINNRYVLKNALIPMFTVIGLQFAKLVGGLVIIEEVFSFPGMGSLIINAIFNRDYPVLQVSLLLIAATFIIANLLIDLLYGLLDPKIRY